MSYTEKQEHFDVKYDNLSEADMDTKSLKTFMYVAELGSFTKAALKQNYSQPTVSFQIRQLEKELGVTLFDRIGHTVTLTQQGREVLEYAHEIDNLSMQLNRSLAGDEHVSGSITIAMADSLVPPLLGENFLEFRKKYPDISLRIIIAGTEEMYRLLDHNEADFVYTLDSHIYDSHYVIERETPVHVHFAASPKHPMAGKKGINLEELLQQPLLLTEKGMGYRIQFEQKLAAISREANPVLEMGNVDQLCRLASENIGITLLPDFVTRPWIEKGKLVLLDVPECEIQIWSQMLYASKKYLSPAMKLFMGYGKLDL